MPPSKDIDASDPAALETGRLGPSRGGEPLVRLLLFAAAREAAGDSSRAVRAGTVGEVLDQARAVYGEHFTAVLARSRVWVNGEPTSESQPLADGDEVAVLPPVSGG